MAKYDFYASYPGPLGPHLNCLSAFTLTRKDEDRLRGESIHLRVSQRGDKSNTRRAPSLAAQIHKLSGIAGHCQRHPDDKQSEAHRDWLAAEVAKL